MINLCSDMKNYQIQLFHRFLPKITHIRGQKQLTLTQTFDHHRHPYKIISALSRSKPLKSPALCHFSSKLPHYMAYHEHIQS